MPGQCFADHRVAAGHVQFAAGAAEVRLAMKVPLAWPVVSTLPLVQATLERQCSGTFSSMVTLEPIAPKVVVTRCVPPSTRLKLLGEVFGPSTAVNAKESGAASGRVCLVTST